MKGSESVLELVEYLKQFRPSIDRRGSKYYPEMQQLAFNLVRYLGMNDDPNEKQFQGNYNLTYLKENMTHEDFKMLVNMFLRNISIGEVRRMIKEYWTEESANMVLDDNDQLRKDYMNLSDKYDELEDKYNELTEGLRTLID